MLPDGSENNAHTVGMCEAIVLGCIRIHLIRLQLEAAPWRVSLQHVDHAHQRRLCYCDLALYQVIGGFLTLWCTCSTPQDQLSCSGAKSNSMLSVRWTPNRLYTLHGCSTSPKLPGGAF